jgi:hypothetical protein
MCFSYTHNNNRDYVIAWATPARLKQLQLAQAAIHRRLRNMTKAERAAYTQIPRAALQKVQDERKRLAQAGRQGASRKQSPVGGQTEGTATPPTRKGKKELCET